MARLLYVLSHKATQEARVVSGRIDVRAGDVCVLVGIGGTDHNAVNLLGSPIIVRRRARDAKKLPNER